MLAIVLYYCTFRGTVLQDLKYFSFCVCFPCIISMTSIINPVLLLLLLLLLSRFSHVRLCATP